MRSVYLEKNDTSSTLTTYLYCHFWLMWGAEKLGYQSYIHWPQGLSVKAYDDREMFSRVPNQYDWYFEQPMIPIKPIAHSAIWTWELPNPASQYSLMSEPLPIIRDYFQKHLKFNTTTNARGQAIVDKYNIDFSKTIGITWRGTDIYLEQLGGVDTRRYLPIQCYFKFIDEILEKHPDYRIACTAEEEKILDPLFERYPQAFLIEEFKQAPHGAKDNPEKLNGNTLSGFEKGLQPALMVWLFSKCAHYIKNRSSVAAIASWMSNGRIVSIGHPEHFAAVPFRPVAEIEGKEYPLNL